MQNIMQMHNIMLFRRIFSYSAEHSVVQVQNIRLLPNNENPVSVLPYSVVLTRLKIKS